MKSAHERMQGQTLAHHALASALVRAGRTSVAEALRIGFDLEELV